MKWPSFARSVVGAGTAAALAGAIIFAAPAFAGSSSPGVKTSRTLLVTQPRIVAEVFADPVNQKAVVSLNGSGLTPGSAHRVDIRPGPCNTTAAPSITFPTAIVDTYGRMTGTLTSDTTLPGGALPPMASLLVHLGTDASDPLAESIVACGRLGMVPSAHTGLVLKPALEPRAHGTAVLRYDAALKTLRVEVTMFGLPPNSSHAAHVHEGFCQVQGPVIYMLPDLVSDANGTAKVSATFTGVTAAPPTAGWYVNVHLGNMSQILSMGSPTIFFQPVACGNTGSPARRLS